MLKIIFNNKKETQASFKNIKNGVVQLVGKNVNNLNGFKAYNMNDKFLGDYSEYTTKYNIYTEIEDGIMLSTGEVEEEPYVPPTRYNTWLRYGQPRQCKDFTPEVNVKEKCQNLKNSLIII